METPKKRTNLTINMKYEIIKNYESLNGKHGAKEETRKKFELKTISSLDSILKLKESIINAYNENWCSAKRRRLTSSRFSELDNQVYSKFKELRNKGGELSGLDIITQVEVIAKRIQVNHLIFQVLKRPAAI